MRRPSALARRSPAMPAMAAMPMVLLALPAMLLGPWAAAPAGATVAIAVERPLAGDILASPITIAASATTDVANGRVTAWQVYVDGVLGYGTAGPASEISVSLPMDDGTHEVIVRAWDSSGTYDSVSLDVTAGICSGFTVDLQSPVAGTVSSPVQFTAVASSCHHVTGFAVYVDGQRVYQEPGPSSLDAAIDLPAGHHSVSVRATDSTRSTASSAPVPIEVETAPAPKPPAQQRRPPAGQPPPGKTVMPSARDTSITGVTGQVRKERA